MDLNRKLKILKNRHFFSTVAYILFSFQISTFLKDEKNLDFYFSSLFRNIGSIIAIHFVEYNPIIYFETSFLQFNHFLHKTISFDKIFLKNQFPKFPSFHFFFFLSEMSEPSITHLWPCSKSKLNLKSDRVNLVVPASPIECLLYLLNVRAI